MIHLNVVGQHYIILNSLEVVNNLLEKRSSNNSDRKQATMMMELYVSSHPFHLEELVVKISFSQYGFDYKHVQDAIWPMVAKTQEIISPVLPL